MAGHHEQAAAQNRDLLNGFLRVLGPDHAGTLSSREQLAYWTQQAG
jgi:hypothetical protein